MEHRYTLSHERSAEVLRAVLRCLGQHTASWNPISFAVWFEHCAGMNAQLSAELEKTLQLHPQLDDDEVLRLYRECVADVDHDSVQHISQQLQRVMMGVAQNASTTGASAGQFGADIDQLTNALRTADTAALPALLHSAAHQATGLKATTTALVQKIREGQQEIERLRADLSRARDEALLDPMTRVLNRKGFDLRLKSLMTEASQLRCEHSLIMIDIDHFKQVNDTHGHVLGDRVIQGLAELLRRGIPRSDCHVARYGGEEFAVLLPHTPIDVGLEIAESVRARAGAMKIRDMRTQKVVASVTISAGVATLVPGEAPSAWVARADAALYRSKQGGRDRVTRA